MSYDIHGRKLSPFEQGYAAFKAGKSLAQNPFDKEDSPRSYSRWLSGWDVAQREYWGKQ